jgi:hypothetical protein
MRRTDPGSKAERYRQSCSSSCTAPFDMREVASAMLGPRPAGRSDTLDAPCATPDTANVRFAGCGNLWHLGTTQRPHQSGQCLSGWCNRQGGDDARVCTEGGESRV